MELDSLVKKVKGMRNLSEMLFGSIMVTRMNGDFGNEWKFSPFGFEGDYDRDCFWVAEDELEQELADLLVIESSRQISPSGL